jgi:UDP-N-acetylmuramyl tripeptide synthase
VTTTPPEVPTGRALPRAPRAAVAVAAGRLAGRLSRLADVGDGTAIGGRVATTVMPDLVPVLSRDTDVVLVTATNGKSTVATMLAAALRSAGPVAFNAGGSNMLPGVAMALCEQPGAPRAVLEVDEMVLGRVARATGARWVVLMNASREYTRGVSLERTLEHWRQTLADSAVGCTVVASCDDPTVVEVVAPLEAAGRVVWVAGGLAWREDARLCRRCGARVRWPADGGPEWVCSGCGMARPQPDWSVDGTVLRGPDGVTVSVPLALPGRWLSSNAAFAVAAAAAMGVPPADAVRAVTAVSDVDGRYRAVDVDGRRVRLFLVKNPASWAEAVSLGAGSDAAIVLAMEAFSIRDLTPGWDVDLTPLRGSTVVASGQRRLDVAVMLEAAGVAHTVVADPLAAIASVPPGEVHVIANYTAFKDLRRVLTP